MLEYKLGAKLLIENSKEQLSKLSQLVSKEKQLQLNLSNITSIDSAGIALLIEIKQLARKNNCALTYTYPTALIENLCQLYKITL